MTAAASAEGSIRRTLSYPSFCTVETLRLSTKGQIVIPKEIRAPHRWEPGTELFILERAVHHEGHEEKHRSCSQQMLDDPSCVGGANVAGACFRQGLNCQDRGLSWLARSLVQQPSRTAPAAS